MDLLFLLYYLVAFSYPVWALPAEESTKTSTVSAASPSASCGAEGPLGEVKEFVKHVPSFCSRKFNTDHTHEWDYYGIRYGLYYKAAKDVEPTSQQCIDAIANGLIGCYQTKQKIAKAGTAWVSKGEFSWKLISAPPVPDRTCQSPDHPADRARFTAWQAEEGYKQWSKICRTQFSPQSSAKDYVVSSCVLHYNPCAKSASADKSVDIVFNVTQTVWKSENAAFDMRLEELRDQYKRIVHECDTDTETRKWGGASIVNDDTGTRDYTIYGIVNKDLKYDKMTTKTLVEYIDKNGALDEQCKTWIAE